MDGKEARILIPGCADPGKAASIMCSEPGSTKKGNYDSAALKN
jgi:hypothetical protein